MNVTRAFAINVRMYRKRLGLSQEAFAERCHLHRIYISSLELEKRNISLKNVQAIADALGVEPYRLFLDPSVEYDGALKYGKGAADASSDGSAPTEGADA